MLGWKPFFHWNDPIILAKVQLLYEYIKIWGTHDDFFSFTPKWPNYLGKSAAFIWIHKNVGDPNVMMIPSYLKISTFFTPPYLKYEIKYKFSFFLFFNSLFLFLFLFFYYLFFKINLIFFCFKYFFCIFDSVFAFFFTKTLLIQKVKVGNTNWCWCLGGLCSSVSSAEISAKLISSRQTPSFNTNLVSK